MSCAPATANDPPTGMPIRDAIVDAELLLAHATNHGIDLPPELLKTIVSAKALLQADLQDAGTFEAQAVFWAARKELTKAVLPVTIASLKASAHTGSMALYRKLASLLPRAWRPPVPPLSPAERSVLWFRFLASLALFLLLAVQVYWVVGSRVIDETATILAQVQENKSALEALNADDPRAQALEAKRMTLETEISIRYDILAAWNKVWSAPFHVVRTPPPVSNPGYDDLQSARLVGEFAAQSIERYLLPLLYGWLGACLYVLRKLAGEIKAQSYTVEQNMIYRLRIYMGSLAGLIVVWFLPIAQTDGSSIKSLSIFAVALLVGYSIDLLFAVMDRIIATFTTA